ncbi:hypothetical protein H8356DRAFT_1333822 [Neocallimastix lanati (nom. inval.)]|nr:hypothetical protein H8356DRAFT_1333822 [Neocallimastix sp. JGI-2020a]
MKLMIREDNTASSLSHKRIRFSLDSLPYHPFRHHRGSLSRLSALYTSNYIGKKYTRRMKITPYKFRRYLWVNRETLCLLVPNTNHHEAEKIKNVEKEIHEIIYKINQDDNNKINNSEKENHSHEIKDKLKNVKELLNKYENELTNSEVKSNREEQFILLLKEYERIENIASINAIGETDNINESISSEEKKKFIEDEEGLLQLQEILLDEQDKNLDILAEVIEKQKEIGIAITNEIDETTEKDLEDTQQRLDRTKRRINKVTEFHELTVKLQQKCKYIVNFMNINHTPILTYGGDKKSSL